MFFFWGFKIVVTMCTRCVFLFNKCDLHPLLEMICLYPSQSLSVKPVDVTTRFGVMLSIRHGWRIIPGLVSG